MNDLIYFTDMLSELGADALTLLGLYFLLEILRIAALTLICYAAIHRAYLFLIRLEDRKAIAEITGEDTIALNTIKDRLVRAVKTRD